MMDNKEKITTKNNKTPRKKEMQKEWVYKLDDSYFKGFFLKYSRERKYLFTKVDNNMLAEFAAMEFSLKDILTCKYIELYKKAKGINEETFRKEVLKYMTINDSKSEKDETENRESQITDIEKTELERKKFKKIKKDAIYYIEDNIGDKTAGDSKKLLANYDSFEDNQIEYLSKTFDYIFDGNKIIKEFFV